MDVSNHKNSDQQSPDELYMHEHCCHDDYTRLKFDAYWDDRASPYGEIHKLTVFYYLSDNTIQIVGKSDRGRPFIFYKRLRLPKKTEDVFMIPQRSNPLLFGYHSLLAKHIKDRCGINNPVEYYTDEDLKIGQVLNVFGRKVLLTDCDEFTQNYYRQKCQMGEFMPILEPIESKEPIKAECESKCCLPSDDDRNLPFCKERNYLSIGIKERQNNMKKFLELDNCKLRFKAQVITKIAEHNDHQFIITYYLDDDTISVYKIGGQNDFSSGVFFKRAKYYLPNNFVLPKRFPEPYTSEMLHIGATVEFNRIEFHIVDADEFTLNYMEVHATEYPMANISSVMKKITQAIQPKCKEFLCKYTDTVLSYDSTAMALRELLGGEITEHEIITFLRHFNVDKSARKSQARNRLQIQSMVQTALINCYWDDLPLLKERIRCGDQLNENGCLAPKNLFSVLKSCRFPIKGTLLCDMFSVLSKDQNGNIDVNDLFFFIDSKKCKSLPLQTCDYDKTIFKSCARPEFVDWHAFISKLGPETQLPCNQQKPRDNC